MQVRTLELSGLLIRISLVTVISFRGNEVSRLQRFMISVWIFSLQHVSRPAAVNTQQFFDSWKLGVMRSTCVIHMHNRLFLTVQRYNRQNVQDYGF